MRADFFPDAGLCEGPKCREASAYGPAPKGRSGPARAGRGLALDSQRFSSILPDSRAQGSGHCVAFANGRFVETPLPEKAGRGAPTARPHGIIRLFLCASGRDVSTKRPYLKPLRTIEISMPTLPRPGRPCHTGSRSIKCRKLRCAYCEIFILHCEISRV